MLYQTQFLPGTLNLYSDVTPTFENQTALRESDLPALVHVGLGLLRFLPAANRFNSTAPVTFTYQWQHPVTRQFSAVATVRVLVQPVNDPPAVAASSAQVLYGFHSTLVNLTSTDIDTPPRRQFRRISRFPLLGQLYQQSSRASVEAEATILPGMQLLPHVNLRALTWASRVLDVSSQTTNCGAQCNRMQTCHDVSGGIGLLSSQSLLTDVWVACVVQTSYHATQMLGEPDFFPKSGPCYSDCLRLLAVPLSECVGVRAGESVLAYVPQTQGPQWEFLEFEFPVPVFADGVHVFETQNPGKPPSPSPFPRR